MERLKSMKDALVACAQSQIGNLANVDAEELGEVVDMIKDLEEAIYYCTITKSMEEGSKEKEKEHIYYYTEKIMPDYYRDMDKGQGRMYYPNMNPAYNMYYPPMDMDRMYYSGGNGSSSSNGGNSGGRSSSSSNNGNSGSRNYSSMYDSYPMEIRDAREGKSAMSRKSYMESKEMHQDKNVHMKELEKYMQELSQDITDMIKDASPEEKQLLQQKISTLATKIK